MVFGRGMSGRKVQKKQSPEGSRLRGFYFHLHPLMPGERGGENTSVKSVIHYSDRWIVLVRPNQDGKAVPALTEGYNRPNMTLDSV